MPIRRYNFTGRIRIRQTDADLVLDRDANPLTFSVSRLALDSYGFPDSALVCVEIQKRMSYMRFSCGTVANLELPARAVLTEFREPDGLGFRVKVIDTDQRNSQLLAEMIGRFDDGQDSLLPVESSESLGQEVFRLDFSGEHPVLQINSLKLPDWRGTARDPIFTGLVYPSILRAILGKALPEWSSDDDSNNWQTQWIRFAAQLPGLANPPETSEGDESLLEEWIDSAVEVFCRRNHLYDEFCRYWTRDDH